MADGGGQTVVRGRLKSFDCKKGFGFVAQPNGPDVMVHIAIIRKSGLIILDKQMPVTCDVVQTENGLRATHVRVERK